MLLAIVTTLTTAAPSTNLNLTSALGPCGDNCERWYRECLDHCSWVKPICVTVCICIVDGEHPGVGNSAAIHSQWNCQDSDECKDKCDFFKDC
ncbi:hypothetical protein P154DRAFT_578168 [Amniculicola lignicola CBS 123094]|uniref:Uncharacterized protein n=1 Tax=Amniculicola lignicola CBS 123094 TaxID=1392246 RepID=A0A6A5WAF2_9PLEO|nr:hypothetical protein P154DRAFT_578168 [Amniculicola lignicola CBS 123094]